MNIFGQSGLLKMWHNNTTLPPCWETTRCVQLKLSFTEIFAILNKTDIVHCSESVALAYAVEACVNSLYWISSNPTLLTWIFLFQIDFYDHQNSFYLVLLQLLYLLAFNDKLNKKIKMFWFLFLSFSLWPKLPWLILSWVACDLDCGT